MKGAYTITKILHYSLTDDMQTDQIRSAGDHTPEKEILHIKEYNQRVRYLPKNPTENEV